MQISYLVLVVESERSLQIELARHEKLHRYVGVEATAAAAARRHVRLRLLLWPVVLAHEFAHNLFVLSSKVNNQLPSNCCYFVVYLFLAFA